MKEWLTKFASTRWKGKGKLWLDPEGNTATDYECHLNFLDDGIRYKWMYENEEKTGSFRFNDAGAIWNDSWHQPSPVQCTSDSEAWGLFTVSYQYEVPENPNWGWRSKLSQRPDGTLVLQMTNIAPWGEEGRAVRMVFQRD